MNTKRESKKEHEATSLGLCFGFLVFYCFIALNKLAFLHLKF